MPQPHRPMFTTTADALVIADFSPRGPRTPPIPRTARDPGPYRRLLATPGARAFTIGNLLARLPMGMFSVSAVVMIAGTRGSYALAGAVTATGLAATAVVAPWTARLIDRHGQAKIAVPATVLGALGSLALLLCVRLGAPDWTLFLSYAATATTPNLGGMSRARWAHLLDGDEESLHVANSFEQVVDEACFMLGPVLAALLCGSLFPEAGTLAGVVLLVTGVLVFSAQRSTEPPIRRPTFAHAEPPPRAAGSTRAESALSQADGPRARADFARRSRSAGSPLRAPGIRPLLAVCLALGAVFGSLEVVTIAFADAQGHRSAAGVVLALQAAGSCAAGLAYGATRRTGPAEDRYVWCVAAMTALLTLPLLAASLTGSLPAVAAALLVAGMATAPTMVTGMTLVQRRTPPGRLNEGMTLAVTGLLGGIACGSAAGGWTAEHMSPVAGFGVPATAGAVALMIALVSARSSNRFT
ncbi:MFS transporter [Streptomyces sp. NPDC019531]|uniref:MFS transporter n=1 Tax=Streptomyces sp. NPDC019531 TaxID=3365062 RepID=UPI00384BFE4E